MRVGSIVLLCLALTVPGFPQERLSLDDCIAISLINNSDYNNARHRVRLAEATTLGSYTSILPSLRTSFSSSQTRIAPTSNNRVVVQGVEIGSSGGQDAWRVNNNHRWSMNFSQTIYDGGGWWNEIRQARRSEAASQERYADARQNTILATKLAYGTLLQDAKQLEVLQESLRRAEEQLKRSEAMYRVGSVAQIDVFRSRVNRNNAQAALLTQETKVEISRAELNVVMGRDQHTPLEIVEYEPHIAPLDRPLEELVAVARQSHPQLRDLQYTAEAAQYGVKVAKGRLLPQVGVGVSYTRNNSIFDRVYGELDKNYNWGYSASVSFNLFDGYATKSSIDRAKANEMIAEENITAAERTLERNVRQHYLNYGTALQRTALYEDNLVEAEETLRLAEGRYREGAGTVLEIVDAQENLTRARILLVQAKYDAEMNRARLEAVTGLELGDGLRSEETPAAPRQ